MHSGEPDPIFLAPRRPRKGPGKLARSVSIALSSANVRNCMVATVLAVGERDMMRMPTRSRSCARARGPKHQSARDRYGPAQ
jgi:hypothetical protein